MFKIALNAGHGKNTIGKRCLKKLDKNQTREWVLNSRICEKIEMKLKAYTGYELIRLDDPTGEKDVSLKKRTDTANNFGADFYLSIHHNAGVKGGTGGGAMAFVYTKPSKKALEWQKAAIADGFKITGADGVWDTNCKLIAEKAVCKKRTINKYKNLNKIVQKAVNAEVDGKFGKDTQAAVKAYQNKHNLIADGCVGPATWAVILDIK